MPVTFARGVDRQIINQFISDRYQLLSEIGSGGTGTVYLAEHKKLKVYRAIKCISKTSSMQPSPFLEVSLLKNLNHPGIPVIYDIEEDAQSYYIIEEYIQGVPLSYYCKKENALSEEAILNIGIQLCGILEYLHDQSPNPVVYLDLKPEHIIVCENQIKIVDFGQASYLPNNGKVRKFFATPEFAAPELLLFAQGGKAADIYGFGAVMYSLFFHQRYSIEKKDKFSRKNKNLNFVLPVLHRCLAQNEKERFSSIQEVGRQMAELQKIFKEKNKTSIKIEEKYDKYRHLYTKIVLIGSSRRAGVTFTAVSLVTYLNQYKLADALYVEKNISDFIRKTANWNDIFQKEKGVYQYGDFKGIPRYGAGVRFEIPPQTLCVEDFGNDTESFLEEIETEKAEERKLLVVFLVENSCWEWERAVQKSVQLKNALEQMGLSERHMEFKLMLDGVLPKEVKEFEQFFQCRVVSMPWDPNPFRITADKRKTMKSLLQKGGG